MLPEERTSNPTTREELSTVDLPLSDSTTGKRESSPKKRRWLPLVLISLVVILLIGGVSGIVIYQNNANVEKTENKHNAYLASLSENGTQAFSDPLSQENGSQWVTKTGEGACQFTEGAYHVQTQGHSFKRCHANGTYTDFAFEVQFTMNQGGCGGILFRDDDQGHYYYFRVCQSDGSYDIARYGDYSIFRYLPSGKSNTIHAGTGESNKIAVRASGSNMTFYINEQQITQAQDDVLTSGAVGLAANRYHDILSDVAYTNARLWTL